MINEIEVNGRTYVDKEELLALIKEHKMKARAGDEPGFIEKDEGKRLAAFLALNHLGAAIRYKDAVEAAKHCTVTLEAVKERAEKLKKQHVIVAFTTGKDGTRKMDYFAAWVRLKPELPEKVRKQLQDIGLKEEESAPMFASDWKDAMVFTDPEFAKIQAERVKAFYNEDDKVIAVPYLHIATKGGRRLLEAIFRNEKDAEKSDVEYSPSEEDE